MKDTDKVTLTLGQIKKLVKESKDHKRIIKESRAEENGWSIEDLIKDYGSLPVGLFHYTINDFISHIFPDLKGYNYYDLFDDINKYVLDWLEDSCEFFDVDYAEMKKAVEKELSKEEMKKRIEDELIDTFKDFWDQTASKK